MSQRIRTTTGIVGVIALFSLFQGQRSGASVPGDLVTAELVGESRSVEPGHPFWIGIRLTMADGWHINWTNPGDAGLAPTVEWDLPAGFRVEAPQWPEPRRFSLPELTIFGYEHSVLVPVRLVPPANLDAGADVHVSATIGWLACREACVPGRSVASLTIPVQASTPAKDPRWAAAFDSARTEIPITKSAWAVSASFAGGRIVLVAKSPRDWNGTLRELHFFPFESGLIENGAEQVLTKDADVYRLSLEPARIRDHDPRRVAGVLVADAPWADGPQKALTIDVPVE